MTSINNWLQKLYVAYPDKTERIVYLLIFLFPIAGMSVRHWITNIFNLLVLIGLFTLRKPHTTPIHKEEKIFLWICATYFTTFLISAFTNDWGQAQTYYLGTELRFLLVIPLYLLVRRYPDCSIWFLRGAVVSGFILLGQAYFDVYIMGYSTARGIYSKNLMGPFAVLVTFWCIYYFWDNLKKFKLPSLFLIIFAIVAALFTVTLSGSRGSYVGLVVTAFFSIMFFSKPRWMAASVLITMMAVFLFYQNLNIIKKGVDKAIVEVQQYINAEDHVNSVSSRSSAGIRLEMIRTGFLIIKDNPLTGIGPGNYNQAIKKYINEKKVYGAVGFHTNPHNTFIEVATAKGIIGLLTVLLLFYYPVYIYIRDYKTYKSTAILGLIHIIAISTFSLTDHSIIVKNNYSSILLLGIAIFLSAHIQEYKNTSSLHS